MKTINCFLIVAAFFAACSQGGGNTETRSDSADTEIIGDPASDEKYSNARFRNVTIEKSEEGSFVVTGQAQIFEANFGWVVEDGHQELEKGFEMTDAGAPAWGNFKFEIDVQKQRANSTLTLVLYESSAKDGSRQHELPIPLK